MAPSNRDRHHREMDKIQESRYLKEMTGSEGWRLVKSWIDDDIEEKTHDLIELMANHPDLIDKKKGYSLGLPIKAYRDLLERIDLEIKHGE